MENIIKVPPHLRYEGNIIMILEQGDVFISIKRRYRIEILSIGTPSSSSGIQYVTFNLYDYDRKKFSTATEDIKHFYKQNIEHMAHYSEFGNTKVMKALLGAK